MPTTNLEELKTKTQALIEHCTLCTLCHTLAFEAHPQCNPPNKHPTIFFLYDFVRNTFNQIKNIDPAKFAAGDRAAKSAVAEADGRNSFASMLINDKGGQVAKMTGADPSNPADFGEDIKAKARALAV
ncbi:hypothetical protein N7535_007548 [Penicillium sp. DV-2018c]|nr:hypothetical protein N7461_003573 [Penicillium sp. DV-2018c]KAJ5565910.1 hypothetical protein N7535_007548 [Penicillium sp. DV-2018c]